MSRVIGASIKAGPGPARPQLYLADSPGSIVPDAVDMLPQPAGEDMKLNSVQRNSESRTAMFKKLLSGIGAFKQRMPQAQNALPGRAAPLPLHNAHFVHGRELAGRFPEGLLSVYFGMGCFWGVERLFWAEPGVHTTAVGYAGGFTPNPTYREVCSGETGHAEVALVVYDPAVCPFDRLLKIFWENHDPTQGMRQGNDMGTQYRSAIYCTEGGQYAAAEASMTRFQAQLSHAGLGQITTQLVYPAPPFYYAEDDHQQYLAKNPGGYCGLQGTGLTCSIPQS